MISILDFKAYALKLFFNALGKLGSTVLNFGLTRDLDSFRNVHYGSDFEQRLDVLRPKLPRSSGYPVLVYFHGGGWISADKGIYKGVAARFSRNGFLTFNVNYRLAPRMRFPAPLEDTTRAVEWIYRNASRFGGDPTYIVLAGDSAGAQLASWYASALRNDDLFRQVGIQDAMRQVPVKGLLLFYGVYDFDSVLDARFPHIKTYARSYLGADSQTYGRNAKLASPIGLVSRDLPPTLLCAGEKDGLFTQSEAYAQALVNRGVQCRTLFFSDGRRANHGFLFFWWLRSSKAAYAAALEFLRE